MKIEIAQCVCPSVLIGLKFNLNSEDKLFNILCKIYKGADLEIQYREGNQKISNVDLNQLPLKFNQINLGSKTENKLFITSYNILLLL